MCVIVVCDVASSSYALAEKILLPQSEENVSRWVAAGRKKKPTENKRK